MSLTSHMDVPGDLEIANTDRLARWRCELEAEHSRSLRQIVRNGCHGDKGRGILPTNLHLVADLLTGNKFPVRAIGIQVLESRAGHNVFVGLGGHGGKVIWIAGHQHLLDAGDGSTNLVVGKERHVLNKQPGD